MTDGRRNDACFAGLVLAGGEGRRYGGPKAWARLPDGRSFLDACVNALLDAGARPVAATVPPGYEGRGVDGLDLVVLPRRGLDMFASLRIGLTALARIGGWTRAVLLPVDHPLVKAETIRVLAAASGRAVIPRFQGKHGHPVVIDRTIAASIADGVRHGPTLRNVLDDAAAVDLEVADPGTVANCNTPDELARALSRRG